MAELSAVPFSALPQASDGYTVLYENDQVCRSEKKLSELVGNKTSSFLTKEQGDSLYQEKGDYLVDDDITGKLDKSQYANDSATFLTQPSLDEYATMDWVEEQNYITGVDLTNYYTKSETSGKEEIEAALDEKQDKLTFAGTSNTITSINNSAISGEVASNSWKQLSEDYHSSGEVTGGKFCVYVGKYNTGFNDSYTMGRENYSERGVNIGYANKINVERLEVLPGNVNIGKENVVLDAGAINIGQNNSAEYFGVNVGEHSKATVGSYNIGNRDIANKASINIGEFNSADIGSYNIGQYNSAYNAGYTFGQNNKASTGSIAIGLQNSARDAGFVLGQKSYAHDGAVSIGINCTANNGCFSIGSETSASNGSVIMGNYISANGGSVALGSHLSAFGGALTMGSEVTAQNGSTAYGHHTTAINGSVSIGDNIVSLNGSLVIGNNNNAYKGDQVFGNDNNALTGSTIVGFKNFADFATVIGNDNNINNSGANLPENYTKPSTSDYIPPEEIQIKSFVAGLGNTAYYAKNAYILGHYNKITINNDEYLNTDNDGFTFIYGMRNSAYRNWDMSIGYKSIASGGENIAIGVPFETITGYNPYDGGYYLYGLVNTQARGYKNIAIRSNITGINNIAYNSTLTGDLMNLTSTWVKEELSKVLDNQIKNAWVSGTSTGGNYTSIQRNIIDNANIVFNSKAFNKNIITNADSLNIVDDFNNNTILHSNGILISAIDEYSNANGNTLIGCSNFNLNSKNIVDNLFLNITAFHTTADRHIKDNILIKTTVAPCSSMSSINENIVFNSLIYGNDDSAYRGWGTSNDSNTTFTRNFIFGTNVGNYVYNTFSFSDNSNSNPDYYRLSNTIRTFNFGDNTINKSENSFIFGDENKTSAISRTFVFGKQNNINKTKLTNDTRDYVTDIFVFGYENNVIADNNNVTNPILERNRIFGIHNLIKSSEHLNDNLIVGNCNSISYNTTKPTKNTIRQNVNYPSTPYSSESAAFATYRNNIFGNGNRISQCITDSLIVGAGNYVFDTIVHTPSMTADYNSIYTLGVGNIAYDGSNQLNIGYNNETSGHFAEAIGDGIVAKGQQLIIGKCNAIVDNTNRYSIEYDESTSSIVNIEPSGVIFVIGNGTYDYTTGYYTQRGNRTSGYLDKNNNVIPSANVNNEEYITRSNALIVSANGVVSANDYYNVAGDKLSDLTEIIALLRIKPTTGTYVIKCIDGTLTWVAET